MNGTAPEAVVTDDERTDTDAEDTVTDVEEDIGEEVVGEGEKLEDGEKVDEMPRFKNVTFKRTFVLAVFHDGELVVKRNVENRTRLY